MVVIGGGPGGSTAAADLARKGHHVILLEKQKHPRYAVGENMLPDVWKYCDQIGVSEKIEREGFLCKAGGICAMERTIPLRPRERISVGLVPAPG